CWGRQVGADPSTQAGWRDSISSPLMHVARQRARLRRPGDAADLYPISAAEGRPRCGHGQQQIALSAALSSRYANSRSSTWRWPAFVRPRSIRHLVRGAFVVGPEPWYSGQMSFTSTGYTLRWRGTSTAQSSPRAVSPCRNGALSPYPASASTHPKRRLAAIARSISAKAISGLDRGVRCSTGTRARFKRATSLV